MGEREARRPPAMESAGTDAVGGGGFLVGALGSRQEYWSGLPFPSPGDLPNPEIEPTSLTSPALAGRFFTTRAPWEAPWTGWAAVKWALEPSSESRVFAPAPSLCTEDTGYAAHPPGV